MLDCIGALVEKPTCYLLRGQRLGEKLPKDQAKRLLQGLFGRGIRADSNGKGAQRPQRGCRPSAICSIEGEGLGTSLVSDRLLAKQGR